MSSEGRSSEQKRWLDGKEKTVNGNERCLSTCAGAAVNQAFLVQAIPIKMCKCRN